MKLGNKTETVLNDAVKRDEPKGLSRLFCERTLMRAAYHAFDKRTLGGLKLADRISINYGAAAEKRTEYDSKTRLNDQERSLLRVLLCDQFNGYLMMHLWRQAYLYDQKGTQSSPYRFMFALYHRHESKKP